MSTLLPGLTPNYDQIFRPQLYLVSRNVKTRSDADGNPANEKLGNVHAAVDCFQVTRIRPADILITMNFVAGSRQAREGPKEPSARELFWESQVQILCSAAR